MFDNLIKIEVSKDELWEFKDFLKSKEIKESGMIFKEDFGGLIPIFIELGKGVTEAIIAYLVIEYIKTNKASKIKVEKNKEEWIDYPKQDVDEIEQNLREKGIIN